MKDLQSMLDFFSYCSGRITNLNIKRNRVNIHMMRKEVFHHDA